MTEEFHPEKVLADQVEDAMAENKLNQVKESADEVYELLFEMLANTKGLGGEALEIAKTALEKLSPIEAALLVDVVEYNSIRGYQALKQEEASNIINGVFGEGE